MCSCIMTLKQEGIHLITNLLIRQPNSKLILKGKGQKGHMTTGIMIELSPVIIQCNKSMHWGEWLVRHSKKNNDLALYNAVTTVTVRI